jgi:prepilin-type N-terminal cleavage/methylation domain-containing protein
MPLPNTFRATTRTDIMRQTNTSRGFTLLEMMVSMALGLLVVGGATLLYKQSVDTTWMTSQKSEMQQDFRAVSNLMERDIGMAGSGSLGQQGLGASSVALPVSATFAVYPCSATTCNYINGAPVAYPSQSGANYLYSVIPGNNLGITVNGQTTDILTVTYTDANLALNCYTVTYNSATSITFTLPTVLPSTCILPQGLVVPQALNNTVVGLQTGDVILFSTSGAGAAAVGVVTGTPTTGTNGSGQTFYTVPFALGDPGHINQPAVSVGSLKALAGQTITAAVRLLVITYYLDISPSDGVTPRLMRVQSGRPPAPVAENVMYLKFSYDVYNGGAVSANQNSLPVNTTPGMITKVNITHMTMRSQLKGVKGYQGLDLQTSITPRNLTFQQEYPISGSAY